MLLSTRWGWSFTPFGNGAISDDEIAPIRTFRCRDARTLRPTDRALLLSYIRKEWGSEDAFDAFVRTELPLMLVHNKHRFTGQLCRIAGEHLDVAFGGGPHGSHRTAHDHEAEMGLDA